MVLQHSTEQKPLHPEGREGHAGLCPWVRPGAGRRKGGGESSRPRVVLRFRAIGRQQETMFLVAKSLHANTQVA